MGVSRKTVVRAGQAGAISLGVLLLVALFVSVQAPAEERAVIEPPIALPPLADAAPMDEPDEAEEEKPAKEQPAERTEPAKSAASASSSGASAPPPVKKAAPPPARVTPATPPASTDAARVASQPLDSKSLRVKFRTVEDLASLIEDAHVEIVLEYPDGARFLLPRDFDLETITFRIPEPLFSGWVDEGRVSELIPNRELLNRLEVHQDDLRYLAVLDAGLRDSVEAEALRAQVNPQRSVLMIEQGPKVSVALARK